MRIGEVLTMAEYIRREDAIKCIEGQCVDGKMWGNDESEGTLIEAYSAIDDLMEIPPADVAPVRHARWDENGRCTNCGGHAPFWCMASTYYKSPWCHECGAKMDLED